MEMKVMREMNFWDLREQRCRQLIRNS